MRVLDEVIWDEFIKNHPNMFSRVWYNVPLGDPFPEEEEKIQAESNGALEVSQWRIDVLGETPDGFAVIELKPHAAAGALGQALAYKELLRKEWNIEKPIQPIVLTDKITPILEQASKLLNVVVLVP